jgi:hypothetical protein
MTHHGGKTHAAFFTTTTQIPTKQSRSTLEYSTLALHNYKYMTHSRLNLAASSSSSSSSLDDDIKKQVAKAKELLEKAKAKQAAEEDNNKTSNEEINSHQNIQSKETRIKSMNDKRNRVTKSKNEGTGLITTDGDLMALLSEDEEWELKCLEDVFENEIETDDHRGLADRDVAASIFNLRMTLHNEDYKKIFDTRNRWIGEDN